MNNKTVRFAGRGLFESSSSSTQARGPFWSTGNVLLDAAASCAGDPQPILGVLAAATEQPPVPARGQSLELWEFLASVAALDLSAVRALEPHLDAAAILDQAGIPWTPGETWAVYAAEASGMRLDAREEAGEWKLYGTKPWCSLASKVSSALISAHTSHGRALFAVRMSEPEVNPDEGIWASRGLKHIPSGPVHFTGAPAQPVGEPGWYLERQGFAVGGVGVAACWFGGAVGIFRHLLSSATTREPDQLALAWLGEADRLLASGAALLHQTAAQADQGLLGASEANRVRGHIAELCERMILLSGHATGPAPLTSDEDHARRIADLSIYLRQHHAARDDAALGNMLLKQIADQEQHPW